VTARRSPTTRGKTASMSSSKYRYFKRGPASSDEVWMGFRSAASGRSKWGVRAVAAGWAEGNLDGKAGGTWCLTVCGSGRLSVCWRSRLSPWNPVWRWRAHRSSSIELVCRTVVRQVDRGGTQSPGCASFVELCHADALLSAQQTSPGRLRTSTIDQHWSESAETARGYRL
jgi:hypothetical protein